MNWWQRLRKRDRLETELDAELRFHFESQVRDSIRKGMPEEGARRRARIEFGVLDQVKEDRRDARGTRWIGDIAQDFRFAARLLAKDRCFTLAAAIALALGIGLNNTVFENEPLRQRSRSPRSDNSRERCAVSGHRRNGRGVSIPAGQ